MRKQQLRIAREGAVLRWSITYCRSEPCAEATMVVSHIITVSSVATNG